MEPDVTSPEAAIVTLLYVPGVEPAETRFPEAVPVRLAVTVPKLGFEEVVNAWFMAVRF